MASYPSSVKTFTNPGASTPMDTAGVYHDVQHSEANDEINAIETELGVSPKTITDNVSPATSPSSVAQFLDMVATQLKAIVGGANWYTSVTSSLADLVTHLAATAAHGATGAVVGTTNSQTLTNKTLTSPVVNSPTGIVKGDVGLSNVDNTSDSTKNSATATLTNKRITPRITTITSSATPTINTDNCDCVTITALAAAITSMTTNLSGTPSNFDSLLFRIKDDGTGRAITWGASFASRGATLPTTTVANKVLYAKFFWNSVASTWDCVATATES